MRYEKDWHEQGSAFTLSKCMAQFRLVMVFMCVRVSCVRLVVACAVVPIAENADNHHCGDDSGRPRHPLHWQLVRVKRARHRIPMHVVCDKPCVQ